MPERLAEALVNLAGVYAAMGVAFAVPFVCRSVARLDPQARGGTWGFRLLILPGSVALWPLLAWRWARRLPPPEERNAHRHRARRLPRPEGRSGEGAR